MAADSSSSRRFDIALSFPGEHRDYVEEVAGHLVPAFNKERVLYDKYYEAEFARPDLDVYLPGLYRTQSELIVLFLCPEYAARMRGPRAGSSPNSLPPSERCSCSTVWSRCSSPPAAMGASSRTRR